MIHDALIELAAATREHNAARAAADEAERVESLAAKRLGDARRALNNAIDEEIARRNTEGDT